MNEPERSLAALVASSYQYSAAAAECFRDFPPAAKQAILVGIEYMKLAGKAGSGKIQQIGIQGEILHAIATLALESLARLTANKSCSEAEKP